jgi:hypothetical protein
VKITARFASHGHEPPTRVCVLCSSFLDRYAATDVNLVRVVDSHNGLRRAERAKPTTRTNEALPQTVEHVGIYADLSVGLRLGLVSLYVVLPRLRRGVALTEKS